MVEPNENFVIFLILFMLSFSMPKFMLLFGAKLLFMLFMLLIAFQVLLSKIKFHMSAFLGHLQTITAFPSFGSACFVLLQPHEHNKLEPRSRLCCFLGYAKLKRGIGVMILSLIVFVSPKILSLGNIAPLSNCSLLCLPIFLLCLRTFSR